MNASPTKTPLARRIAAPITVSALIIALPISACSTDDEPYQLVDVHIGESTHTRVDHDPIYTLELTWYADHDARDAEAYEARRKELMSLYGARDLANHETIHGTGGALDSDRNRLVRWPSPEAYERFVANAGYDALSELRDVVTARTAVVRVETQGTEPDIAALDADEGTVYVWTAVDADLGADAPAWGGTIEVARYDVVEVYEGRLDIDAITISKKAEADVEALIVACDAFGRVLARPTK